MLSLLVAWRANGGSRLDRDDDGAIDDPGAAIMDVAFPLIADNAMAPILGPQLDELNSLFTRFDQPPGGQYSGWYQYMDRDLRALLSKERLPDEFNIAYCGHGKLGACQQAIWAAIQAAGPAADRRSGHRRPGRLALERHRRADRLLADAADQHALHEPPQRDPAGHLVQEVI